MSPEHKANKIITAVTTVLLIIYSISRIYRGLPLTDDYLLSALLLIICGYNFYVFFIKKDDKNK